MIVENIKARRTAIDGSVKYLKKFLGLSLELSDVDTSTLMHGSIYREIDTSKCYLFDEGNSEWVEQKSGQGGGGGGEDKPYLSIDKLNRYLYKVVFEKMPVGNGDGSGTFGGACSSYVSDGKLYRNLDWKYDETASFIVSLPGIEGMAFITGLTSDNLDDDLIAKLPWSIVDGVNEHGIMVSTHVLYNDWDAHGSGSIPLTSLPLKVLQTVTSMATIEDDLADILTDLRTTPAMDAAEYLIQVLVTDGETTFVLRPGNSVDVTYEAVDATFNPKLTNFRWVDSDQVDRSELQNRPTGVERWNNLPWGGLQWNRFTDCYEAPYRLSEFIGIDGTTKDSTDEELMAIYEKAHAAYEERTRDGTLWQTMHSVVYSPKGMAHLWIQEDWSTDYCGNGIVFFDYNRHEGDIPSVSDIEAAYSVGELPVLRSYSGYGYNELYVLSSIGLDGRGIRCAVFSLASIRHENSHMGQAKQEINTIIIDALGAVRGIHTIIGSNWDLQTDNKSSIVDGINEVKGETTALQSEMVNKADADDLESLETVVSGKESLSNKVVSTTGISSSSTDTQYPSAKAVNDFVEGKNYITADDITIDSTPTSGSTNAVQSGGTYEFINSSIATNTAYFRGTFESVAELNAYSGTKTNNDYAFVIVYDEVVMTQVKQYDRYKYNGSVWVYEYTLNNSSFTAAQWSAINSSITAAKVTEYDSHIASTDNPHSVTKAQVGLGNVDNTSDVNKPVSTATSEALSLKEDSSNKVTSIGSSSTNSQYPSAKAVYDAISSGIVGDSNVFIATYTHEDGNVTCDKTFGEIEEALDAGKLVAARLIYDDGDAGKRIIDTGIYAGILDESEDVSIITWKLVDATDSRVYDDGAVAGQALCDIIHHGSDEVIQYGYSPDCSVTRLTLMSGYLQNEGAGVFDFEYIIELLLNGIVEICVDGARGLVIHHLSNETSIDESGRRQLYGFSVVPTDIEGGVEVRRILITEKENPVTGEPNYQITEGTHADISKVNEIGNLARLDTESGSTLVDAINEVKGETTALQSEMVNKADADDLESLETVVSGKESLSNKVTSSTGISSSSTDTQYPSAKAVNDFVEGKNYITEDDIVIDSTPTSGSTNAVQSGGTYNFVNSSIATNTAYFRGTYNSVAELNAYSGEKTNNDYAFVIVYDEAVVKQYDRYKYNGSVWDKEYTLNNSSFTANQWAAINSLITPAKVASYDSHLSSNSNPHSVTKEQIGLGNVENTSDVNKPVSTATSTAIANAVSNRPTTSEMNSAIAAAIGGAINGSY